MSLLRSAILSLPDVRSSEEGELRPGKFGRALGNKLAPLEH